MLDPKLKTLLKVSETGNFSRAAEELSLSQPAVSKHIHALEAELGIHIFEYANKEMRLTQEGEIAVKYALRLQAIFHNMESELQSARRQLRTLTVGITHTSETNVMASVLARYAVTHSRVTVKVVSGPADELYVKLSNYELEMAIVEGRVTLPRFRTLMLDTDCLMLVVPPGHPLAGRSSVTLDELKREKLILRPPNSQTRGFFVSTLESVGTHIDEFNVFLEIDNIATIKDLIRRKFGVSVLPRSTCMDELKKGKIVLLPIENMPMVREINLVYLEDFDHPEVLRDILACYQEVHRLGMDTT